MIAFVERWGPVGVALFSAVVSLFCMPWLFQVAEAKEINLLELYGPTFDVATFAAGILFAIYMLLLTPTGSFIQKIFRTKTFAAFHAYVATGIISSMVLAVFSVIYMVHGLPDPSTAASRVAAALWAATAGYALAAVVRVIAVFLAVVKAEGRPDENGRRTTG